MSSEPRDERELKAALAVHTPNWLPGVNLDVNFRRLWDKRQERFAQSVSNATGKTFEELQEQIAQADGLTDILLTAAKRAGERGNTEYADTLARLVAAALIDCAKTDTTAYLVDRIVKLEPIHLRVLVPLAGADRAAINVHETIRIEKLADLLGIDEGIVESCLSELAAVGFVARHEGEHRSSGREIRRLPTWSLTRLGLSAGDTINQVRQDLHKAAGSSLTANGSRLGR